MVPANGPFVPEQQVTFSESHWSTTKTLCEMIQHLDVAMNPAEEKMPWILLLVMASVHTSTDFCGAVKDKYPRG